MTKTQKAASWVAAAGVLIAAVAKLMAGEMPNMTEVILAVTTVAGAFGFQRSA